jgi:hypothetical protein
MPPLEDLSHSARQQLIELLDGRLERADVAERARILAAMTRLFLVHAKQADVATLSLFDRIFVRLADRLPVEPLAALSEALATVNSAPKATVSLLAQHGAPEVATPLLSESPLLPLAELAAVASSGSERHLLAICARPRIEPGLSALLIGRAMPTVIDRLLINPGARFAREDFCDALPRASADCRGRVPLRQPAAILDTAGFPVGRCATLDISPGGIKLQVMPGAPLTETLTVELSSVERIRLRGRIAWRQLSIIGMQFTTPLAEQLSATPNRH